MKKILIHVSLAIGGALVLCLLGVLISSIGRHKSSLSQEETIVPVVADNKSDSQEEINQTESQTDSSSTESDSTIPDLPVVDVSKLEVADDQASNADDEYDSFAIANKIVQGSFVNVRLGASTEEEVIGRMYYGSVAQVLERVGSGEDAWLKMRSGNVEGYIKADYFTYGKEAAAIIDQYTTKIAVCNVDVLYVRLGPSTDYEYAGYLQKGEKATILGYSGDWVEVEYLASSDNSEEERHYYVYGAFVNSIEDYVTAKSMDEVNAQLAHADELQERTEEDKAPEETGNSESNNDNSGNSGSGESSGTTPTPTPTPTPEPTPVTPPSNNDGSLAEKRQQVVNYALQYVGYPYVMGGQSLATGTDCSGFTMYIYQAFGYYISRTPSGQLSSDGISVSLDDLQPGDIICYQVYEGGGCSHVGMYIGDGKIIHDSNPRTGVLVASLNIHTILGAKRIIY